MFQISNFTYCDDFLLHIDIENKLIPNSYKDYPYLIIPNFISKQLSQSIVNHIQTNNDMELAKIKEINSFGIIEKTLKEKYRKTNIYKLNKELESLYFNSFKNFQLMMEEYFNISLTTATDIQVLEYKKGFFYTKHADDSSEILDKEGKTIGFQNVAPSRKLTTVLFCSSYCDTLERNDLESFLGGELVFNYLYDEKGNNITLKPQAGDMVVFPSNPYFSHEVLKVLDGYRLSLVQWHDAIIH